MRETGPPNPLVFLALGLGVLVPVMYYGMQAAAAPSFPDFSVFRVTASELGSDRSSAAKWFNRGILLQGAFSFAAAFGMFAAFARLGIHRWFAALVVSSV